MRTVEAPATDNGSEEPTEPSGPDGSETVEELLADANVLYAEANEALADADLATYQAKINEAFELVTRAEELSGVNGATEDTSPDSSTGHHRQHVVRPSAPLSPRRGGTG